jgi:protein-arginine kinase activator protein McsA
MTVALYCDRCEGLFAGPAHAIVKFDQQEMHLCRDCASELADWISIEEASSKPIPSVEQE